MNEQLPNGGYYRQYRQESIPGNEKLDDDDLRRGILRRRIEDVQQGLELDSVLKEVWDCATKSPLGETNA